MRKEPLLFRRRHEPLAVGLLPPIREVCEDMKIPGLPAIAGGVIAACRILEDKGLIDDDVGRLVTMRDCIDVIASHP